ncbi:MAG: leucine-rich repeat protein [Candidatus Heteroscillospira sp.]
MKKLLKILPVLVIVLSMLCMSAYALSEGDWEYQLLGNEVQITGYLGEGGDIEVPSELHGATVTELDGFSMFSDKATSLTIPGTIKNVDVGIHYGWESLESLILEEGVESISGCILQEYENLTYISLPSTMKTLGEHAFKETAITSIDLPASLKTIDSYAFENSDLESVDMSELSGVTVGVSVFDGCKNLSDVQLPKDIAVIGQTMFAGCESLTSIELPSTVKEIKSLAFRYTGLTEILLPSGLQKLDAGVFANTPLKEVIVPYGVTEVGSGGKYIYGTFSYCDDLKALYIPSTVTKMGTSVIGNNPDTIIYCASGSYAEKLCKDNKISYLTDSSVDSAINVLYNGSRISFGEYGQNPTIVNSRTLVPLRSIFEAMGAEVEWDNATRTAKAERGGVSVSIAIGSNTMYVNGAARQLDCAAAIVNNRTMVPVRAIAEAFGADVDWHNPSRTALIEE